MKKEYKNLSIEEKKEYIFLRNQENVVVFLLAIFFEIIYSALCIIEGDLVKLGCISLIWIMAIGLYMYLNEKKIKELFGI